MNECHHLDGSSNNEQSLPDDTVSTFSNNVEDLVLFTDVEVACARVGGCSHFRDGVA